MTLEQTINRDAASQNTGISFLTDSISARQRWADFHFIRCSIISNVFDKLGMMNKEDISDKLKPYNIRKDNDCVNKLMDIIQANMNPFDINNDRSKLYNLATGKSVQTETEEFLLNVNTIGRKRREQFIQECIADPKRFEKRIEKVKLHTFATEVGRKRISNKDGKLVET